MKLKVNKILTIGLLMCSCQLANTMELNNNNGNNDNNKEKYFDINAVNYKPNLDKNVETQEKDVNNYYIPKNHELRLSKDEFKKFITNIKKDPNLVLYVQQILNGTIPSSEITKLLCQYMLMLIKNDFDFCVKYYNNEITKIINNKENPKSKTYFYNIQCIALINTWFNELFNNFTNGSNNQAYIPNEKEITKSASEITCNVIVKMIRIINLINDLNLRNLDKMHGIHRNNPVLTFFNSNSKCSFVSMF